MVWFNLTGQDSYPWHEIYNWNCWRAEGIAPLAPDDAEAIDKVADNLQEELKTANRDGCLPKFGRPVPQFSNMVSLLEKMLAGEERELVELQKGKLKEVRAKGIGPMMERYKPGHRDPRTPWWPSPRPRTSSAPGPSAFCPCRAPW